MLYFSCRFLHGYASPIAFMFLSFPSHLSLFLFLSPVNNMKLDSLYKARFQSSLTLAFILPGAELCLTLFL